MGENDIPQSKIATFAKVLLVSEAWLMGYDDQIKKEDPNIIERDSILEEIDEILRRNGWSLSCESYDDDYFIIKNIMVQLSLAYMIMNYYPDIFH